MVVCGGGWCRRSLNGPKVHPSALIHPALDGQDHWPPPKDKTKTKAIIRGLILEGNRTAPRGLCHPLPPGHHCILTEKSDVRASDVGIWPHAMIFSCGWEKVQTGVHTPQVVSRASSTPILRVQQRIEQRMQQRMQ
jgi:hypothetical protein